MTSRPPRTVGRPPLVSLEAIASAGVDIGMEDLSVRLVARRLGVTAASLYRHVDGREALEVLVGEQIITSYESPMFDGGSLEDHLVDFAMTLRHFAAQHPGIGPYLMRPPAGSTRARQMMNDHAISLTEAGLSIRDAALVASSVATFTIGVVDISRRAAERPVPQPPATSTESERALRSAREGLAAVAPHDRFEWTVRAFVVGLLTQLDKRPI